MKITKFRELVCISLMQTNQQLTSKITATADIMCEKSSLRDRHPQETDEKEVGKGKTDAIADIALEATKTDHETMGVTLQEKKAKRVTSQRCEWGVLCFIIC